MTEGFKPIAISFSDSINQFYSSVTKGLCLYEYIPLMIAVTIVTVTLIILTAGFLGLLFFNYELNILYLIKFKKSKNLNVNDQMALMPNDSSTICK